MLNQTPLQNTIRRLGQCLALGAVFSGCAGYHFQGSTNPLATEQGVERIYIAPIVNDTYKPGIENVVYNELVRTISQHRRVRIVPHAEEADAVLKGDVTIAVYSPTATTVASQLFPSQRKELSSAFKGSSAIEVATEYLASLGCNFSLEHQHPKDPNARVLWTSSFQRDRRFPGNNQLSVYGTTSALINDSEFDRALRDIARSMMDDVHESMLARF